jgi:hypothetical protein
MEHFAVVRMQALNGVVGLQHIVRIGTNTWMIGASEVVVQRSLRNFYRIRLADAEQQLETDKPQDCMVDDLHNPAGGCCTVVEDRVDLGLEDMANLELGDMADVVLENENMYT